MGFAGDTMRHSNAAELGMIVAIIAAIQLILIASLAHDFQTFPQVARQTAPLETTIIYYVPPKTVVRY